jgi:cysteine desulfurase
MQKLIYLDYAAATPLDASVLAAMQPFFSERFYNPSALYLPAKAVLADLSSARAEIAQHLGCREAEIIFTAGGTEANNLAIKGVMNQFEGSNIVVSAIEHESVLKPAQNFECRVVGVDENGVIKLDELEKAIDDNTVLVSVMYANNEIGTIQPIRKISQIIKTKRTERKLELPLYFHSDAAQAGNYLDLHSGALGLDLITINGGKLYGPKQSGALMIKSSVCLKPLIEGGGQESGLRSGTQNVAQSIGLAKALSLSQQLRKAEVERLGSLQKLFFNLLEQNLPKALINGSKTNRLPNNVHITIPGIDNERLLIQLESSGILAAAGSACSASNEEPSHVLKAMGLSDDYAEASVRFTMGRHTTEDAVRKTVDVLKQLTSV